jgi:hypothetical protein
MTKPHGAERMAVVPITLPVANRHVEAWHRHHGALETVINGLVRTNKGLVWFCLAAVRQSDGVVVGVAVAGRPSNRNSDDGQTIEVHRVATDGTPNACSFLLGAAARVATSMGAYRIITYTLEIEPGTSLRAAGWSREAEGIESCWLRGNGKARPGGSGSTLYRPHMDLGKVRWGRSLRSEPRTIQAPLAPNDGSPVEPEPMLDFGA